MKNVLYNHMCIERGKEREKDMEAVTVFGGGSLCLSSSTSTLRSHYERSCSLSYTHKSPIRSLHHHHLAAFPSTSHLFSYYPLRPHAKTLTKSHIFLPHLVAALVCLSHSPPSFFAKNFATCIYLLVNLIGFWKFGKKSKGFFNI